MGHAFIGDGGVGGMARGEEKPTLGKEKGSFVSCSARGRGEGDPQSLPDAFKKGEESG